MRPWLCVIIALSTASSSCSIGATSASASAGPVPTNDACHGPGCGPATGGASTGAKLDASSPIVGLAPPEDAGLTWSALCGPHTGKCVPGLADDSCDQLPQTSPESKTDSGTADDDRDGADSGTSTTCRIRQASLDSQDIDLVCERAGTAAPGSACAATTDCGAGSTCVSDAVAPVCRQYCCDGPDRCPNGTYCTNRNTYVRSTSNTKYETGPSVPVCVPADNCNLSEPYPCPAGQKCACATGKACMVVKSGGLTTCIEPVERNSSDATKCVGQNGISLCDPGYVCSYVTSNCLKLCKLSNKVASTAPSSDTDGCPSGTSCQASNDVPSGWGVCSHEALIVN